MESPDRREGHPSLELDEALLRRCYAAFNARDLEGALAVMDPEVTWPNGWEGGWVEGTEQVRDYWRRQWAALDPHVEPRAFTQEADGRIAVSVHQVVRDLAGTVLADQIVEHVYQLQDGCIRRMEIRK
jgi:ketosteroid isomerase-like protein